MATYDLFAIVSGGERAAATLIAAGVATALPAAAAGLADWSALHTHQQRVRLAHAIAQTGAAFLFAGSLLARRASRPAGVSLATSACWRCGPTAPSRSSPTSARTWAVRCTRAAW